MLYGPRRVQSFGYNFYFFFWVTTFLKYNAPIGFPGGTSDKESPCNAGNQGSIPGLRRLPTPGFFPGKFHGQRRLADYSPLD